MRKGKVPMDQEFYDMLDTQKTQTHKTPKAWLRDNTKHHMERDSRTNLGVGRPK